MTAVNLEVLLLACRKMFVSRSANISREAKAFLPLWLSHDGLMRCIVSSEVAEPVACRPS
jgi:hypothetical protein